MGLLWGLVLGVIQGATEFLPVSSSAHLAFAGALAGISEKDALPFFLVLHFGTLAALAAYFAGDLLGLAKGCLRLDRTAWRLVLMIALTSLHVRKRWAPSNPSQAINSSRALSTAIVPDFNPVSIRSLRTPPPVVRVARG